MLQQNARNQQPYFQEIIYLLQSTDIGYANPKQFVWIQVKLLLFDTSPKKLAFGRGSPPSEASRAIRPTFFMVWNSDWFLGSIQHPRHLSGPGSWVVSSVDPGWYLACILQILEKAPTLVIHKGQRTLCLFKGNPLFFISHPSPQRRSIKKKKKQRDPNGVLDPLFVNLNLVVEILNRARRVNYQFGGGHGSSKVFRIYLILNSLCKTLCFAMDPMPVLFFLNEDDNVVFLNMNYFPHHLLTAQLAILLRRK